MRIRLGFCGFSLERLPNKGHNLLDGRIPFQGVEQVVRAQSSFGRKAAINPLFADGFLEPLDVFSILLGHGPVEIL